MKYSKVKLNNRSTLVILQMPLRSVTIAAYIKAGFRFDPKTKPGLAHFTEHMLFCGTKKYPTHHDLSYQIERFGGWHSAFTWIEYQNHEVCFPKDKFELGVEVLLETLSRSLIKEEEVEKERRCIEEEIIRNKSDPEKAIWDYAWQPLFFQGTRLARPYSGTIKNIKQITKEDILTFIRNNFTSQNTVFFIAGNVTFSEAQRVMERQVKNYQQKESIKNNPYKVKIERRTQVHVARIESKIVSVAIGFETVSISNSDRHIIEIIKDMLGRDFGASLPEKLRNQGGLIYTWSSFQDNLSDTGYLLFKTSTSKKNILKVIRLTIEEFERIGRGEISDEEVEVSKGHLIGSLHVNIETGSDFIHWYGLQELLIPNAVLHIDDQVNIYKKISKKDVIRVARQYLSIDKILISAVGEVKQADLKDLLNRYK